jgi:peptidyl-prolyl cis-trans isomerase C
MTRRSQPVLLLLTLLLAVLATGLSGCKKDAPGGPADAAQSTAQSTAAAPGQPAQGQPGQAGQIGQETAAAAPQGAQPGAETAGFPTGMPPAAAQAPVDPAKLPDVVAKVNGVEIKKAQLVEEAGQMRQQLAQMQGVQAPLSSGFYKEVLDGIIARTLLQQEAKAANFTLSEQEVNQQLAMLRSQAPNPEAFQKALAANGLTEETLKQRIRRDGAVQKFVQTQVLGGLTVSDQQAKEFYDKNQDKMKKPERVRVRHILIRADANAPAADKEKAKAKADDLLKRAQKGEDFAKLASENSDDPGSKTQGGELPWFTHGQMVPAFDKAAFALAKQYDLSPVVESQFGYHIIQLLGKEPAQAAPFETVKGQIAEFLKQRQSQEKLAAHVQGLRAKGKVETFI